MWELVGYEKQIVRKEGAADYEAFRIHVMKPVNPAPGSEGDRVRTFFFRCSDVDYVPEVGDKIFVETEMFGKFERVTGIYRV